VSIRNMLPFVAGGAVAVFVMELSRWRPARRADAEPEPFGADELAATDDAVARLWPTEPTFDWGPDDRRSLFASLTRGRDSAQRVRPPAWRPQITSALPPRLAS
jgi:hypothetical protein